MSNPVELFRINFDETFAEIVIPCSNSVAVNAIIYWFKIRFMKDCDDVVTNDETSTINQSAFLFDGIKGVEELKCIVIYSNGLFNVELLPNNEPKKT